MSSTLSESTPNERLRTVLEHALGYEEAMERSLARGPGYAPYPFLPAAQVAYSHMLAILAKPALTSADREAMHATLLEVFGQKHYHGVVLFHAACTVDGWLEDTSVEGRPWPSLMGAFMKLLDEERTAQMHSQVPHREIHVAAKRVARRKKQEKRQSHLIFWPVLIAGLAIVVALLWR